MTNSIWSGAFWRATAERVVSTAAQSGLLAVGADQFNVLELDVQTLLGFMGGGAVLALLKALAANGISQSGPSFTESEIVVDPAPRRAKWDDPAV